MTIEQQKEKSRLKKQNASERMRKIRLEQDKNKRTKRIIDGFGMLMLVLSFFAIYMYARTLMPLSVALLVWFIPGILISPFTRNFLLKNYEDISLFWHMAINIFFFGGIALFTFIGINYTSAETDLKKRKFIIIEHHTHFRSKMAYIDYFGIEKAFHFSYSYSKNKFLESDSVTLITKKGRLGYDVVKDWDLNFPDQNQ